MNMPETINSRWIATLADDQLVLAEAQLHTLFRDEERVEKLRSGTRYMLLQGPPPLVNAWNRWMLVSNEARSRGLVVSRTTKRN